MADLQIEKNIEYLFEFDILKKISEQFQDKYEWNNLYSQVAISIGNRSDFLCDSGYSYLRKNI